jgi:hypothetical protein
MPSPDSWTKAGESQIGSEDQLLGTVWVPALCLQQLPAPGLSVWQAGCGPRLRQARRSGEERAPSPRPPAELCTPGPAKAALGSNSVR